MKSLIPSSLKNITRSLGNEPRADWHFSLFSFLIVLVAILILDAWLFANMTRSTPENASETVSEPIFLSRDAIRNAGKSLKENQRKTLSSGVFEDPSF